MARPDESPLSPPARALGPPPLSNAGEHMSAASHADISRAPKSSPRPARGPTHIGGAARGAENQQPAWLTTTSRACPSTTAL